MSVLVQSAFAGKTKCGAGGQGKGCDRPPASGNIGMKTDGSTVSFV